MVPIHTFLALIALLLMMSSCSQIDPPHPGTSAQAQSVSLNQPSRPEAPTNADTGSALEATRLAEGAAQFTLKGSDAETLYRLSPAKPPIHR